MSTKRAKDNEFVDFFSMNIKQKRVIYFDKSWSMDVVMTRDELPKDVYPADMEGWRYKIENLGNTDAMIEDCNERIIIKSGFSIFFDAPLVIEEGWDGVNSSEYVLIGKGSKYG